MVRWPPYACQCWGLHRISTWHTSWLRQPILKRKAVHAAGVWLGCVANDTYAQTMMLQKDAAAAWVRMLLIATLAFHRLPSQLELACEIAFPNKTVNYLLGRALSLLKDALQPSCYKRKLIS